MVHRKLAGFARRRQLDVLVAVGGVLFISVSSGAPAELNLSPQLESYELEGIKRSQLAFDMGGGKKATYEAPASWNYAGSKDSLDLLPQEFAQAKAKVTKWPNPPALSFEVEGRKQLTQRLIGMLPEGSEQIKVQSEELNPLQIDGKQTYLVQLSYIYYGAKFACYSLLLDRSPEALCFRLSCRAADYEKLRDAFQRSLYTWQNL